jgi:hypothetical protein
MTKNIDTPDATIWAIFPREPSVPSVPVLACNSTKGQFIDSPTLLAPHTGLTPTGADDEIALRSCSVVGDSLCNYSSL